MELENACIELESCAKRQTRSILLAFVKQGYAKKDAEELAEKIGNQYQAQYDPEGSMDGDDTPGQ